jgi:hypothetical protein
MEEILKTWKTSRAKYAEFLDNYPLEQLNRIPDGFKNNLIWNIGHVIAAQQGLVYKQSELEMRIPEEVYEKYRSGTVPDGNATEEDRQQLKQLLMATIEQTEADLQAGVFKVYNERTTGTGFHMANLREAMVFVNYHEGLHLGYMMALRKSL